MCQNTEDKTHPAEFSIMNKSLWTFDSRFVVTHTDVFTKRHLKGVSCRFTCHLQLSERPTGPTRLLSEYQSERKQTFSRVANQSLYLYILRVTEIYY